MSDLNDLIATNAVRAYNEGFERGVASEQERIIEVIKSQADEPCCCFSATFGQHDFADLLPLIKGEQK